MPILNDSIYNYSLFAIFFNYRFPGILALWDSGLMSYLSVMPNIENGFSRVGQSVYGLQGFLILRDY